LFSTHPNVENRIAALKQLAIEMGQLPASLGRDYAGEHPEDPRLAPGDSASRGPWSASSDRGPWG
jgi:hypothetical protein